MPECTFYLGFVLGLLGGASVTVGVLLILAWGLNRRGDGA
jgi:hypothetical protein